MDMNNAIKAYFEREGVAFKSMEVEHEDVKKGQAFAKFLRDKGIYLEFGEELNRGDIHYGCVEDYAASFLTKGVKMQDLVRAAFVWSKSRKGFEYWREVSNEWLVYLGK